MEMRVCWVYLDVGILSIFCGEESLLSSASFPIFQYWVFKHSFLHLAQHPCHQTGAQAHTYTICQCIHSLVKCGSVVWSKITSNRGTFYILKPLLCLFLCLKLWRSLINSKRQKASLVYLQYVIYNAKCIMVESYRKRIANNTGNLWILSQLVYVATQLYQIFMEVFNFCR